MKKILIIVNHEIVIYNFRRELVYQLLGSGYEVHLISPQGKKIDELKQKGVKHHEVDISRRGKNPLSDISTYMKYKKIIKDVKPNVVLTYTIKPNIYGGFAAKKLKVPYIANITGLGTAVENKGLLQKITKVLYKRAFKNANVIFFQNDSNMKFFVENKLADQSKFELLPGSGVNLEKFSMLPYPKEKKIIFTFIGRIMKDKGIEEYLTAAEIINSKYSNTEFHVVGAYEDDKYMERIEESVLKGNIIYHGKQNDVMPFYGRTSALINPSYHEGLSNVLLESLASARPVLASDIPGCRETFEEGISGISFIPKNAQSLIEAIEKFLKLSLDERELMGKAGRKKVELEFDRNIVIKSYIDKIEKITGGK